MGKAQYWLLKQKQAGAAMMLELAIARQMAREAEKASIEAHIEARNCTSKLEGAHNALR